MECRKLEITLVSADNLPDIRLIGRMKVYAIVSITGESTSNFTPVDREGETDPRWNFSVDFWVNECAVQQEETKVSIQLLCQRTIREDGFIGIVNISVKRLFYLGLRSNKTITYPVFGTSNGRLDILYRFDERTIILPNPWNVRVEDDCDDGKSVYYDNC